MPGRLSDGERSSESRSTALRRGAAFGNMRKLTMRPGGVGDEPTFKSRAESYRCGHRRIGVDEDGAE
jgi:hypothetical protein